MYKSAKIALMLVIAVSIASCEKEEFNESDQNVETTDNVLSEDESISEWPNDQGDKTNGEGEEDPDGDGGKTNGEGEEDPDGDGAKTNGEGEEDPDGDKGK